MKLVYLPNADENFLERSGQTVELIEELKAPTKPPHEHRRAFTIAEPHNLADWWIAWDYELIAVP